MPTVGDPVIMVQMIRNVPSCAPSPNGIMNRTVLTSVTAAWMSQASAKDTGCPNRSRMT